jgi:diguanylate cyclase (GGDEF)-like protein/PAS domain S-box-containing protein
VRGWRALLEALPDAIVVSDGERIVFANARLHVLTGYEPGTLPGAPLEQLIPIDSRDAHRRAVAAYHAAPDTRPMGLGRPTVCRHADGSEIPVDISLSPLPMHGWIVAVVRDDRDRLRSEAELFHRATHDPLTGLANRAMLDDRLALALERHRRHPDRDRRLVVLYADLDRFKAVNDAHGHAAGDDVLVVAAESLRAAFRPGDTVARVGGDEFVVVCEEMPVGEIDDLAARVVRSVAAAVQATPWPLAQQVTVSVGVAAIEEDGGPVDLQARADRAMYAAKRAGGDRWSGSDGEDRDAEGGEAVAEVGGGDGAGRPVIDVDLEDAVRGGVAAELGHGQVVVVERFE